LIGTMMFATTVTKALLLAILSMATPSSLAQDDYQDYQDYANDYANQDNLYTDYAQKQQEKAVGGGGGYVLWQFPYLIFFGTYGNATELPYSRLPRGNNESNFHDTRPDPNTSMTL
jgi:hypothetical protein